MRTFHLTQLASCLLLMSLVCGKLEWDELSFPESNAEKHQVRASKKVKVNDKTIRTPFNILFRSGSASPDNNGQIMGKVLKADLSAPIYEIGNDDCKSNVEEISHSPDFASILQVGGKLFMLVHFESPRPSQMYLVELQQQTNGSLTAMSWQPTDWSEYDGLWTPCAGSVSPWQTHMGSEEYEPDARLWDLESTELFLAEADALGQLSKISEMMRNWDVYPCDLTIDNLQQMNPYLYGWPTEVAVSEDGTYVTKKHMAMARLAVELPYVMPDNRTVYITDDGMNGMFAMFVADKPNDLSSGALYGAKFEQKGDSNGGEFKITWIHLGNATNDEIYEAVKDGTTFSDIFDYQQPNLVSYKNSKGCPSNYTSINTQSGHECLKVKPGMDKIASRLETRRYAAIKGATTEFSKWEGITYDPVRRRMYTAMSKILAGMEDFRLRGDRDQMYDIGGNNHIKLDYNLCGCVYELKVNRTYVAENMKGLLCGRMDDSVINNECDINNIANPDNLASLTEHKGLVIGEDSTDGHQNDVVWYYELEDEKLTRIESTPYGSETTSVYWYPNINNFAYIVSVVQHPYLETDQERVNDPESTGVEGYVGYFGPLPVSRTQRS